MEGVRVGAVVGRHVVSLPARLPVGGVPVSLMLTSYRAEAFGFQPDHDERESDGPLPVTSVRLCGLPDADPPPSSTPCDRFFRAFDADRPPRRHAPGHGPGGRPGPALPRGCRLGPSPGGSGESIASACWEGRGSSPTTPSRRRWWPRASPDTPTTWTSACGPSAGRSWAGSAASPGASGGRRSAPASGSAWGSPPAGSCRRATGPPCGRRSSGSSSTTGPSERRAFGRALAEVTHRDERAVEGALYVAELAAACARSSARYDRRSAARRRPAAS